jgi:hypothetical protein
MSPDGRTIPVSVVLHDIDRPDDRNRWAADNMSPNCDSEAAELTVRITATYRGQAVRTFFRVDLVPVTNTR